MVGVSQVVTRLAPSPYHAESSVAAHGGTMAAISPGSWVIWTVLLGVMRRRVGSRMDQERHGFGTTREKAAIRPNRIQSSLAECTSPDKKDTEIWLTNAVCYRSECCTAFKVASRHKTAAPYGLPSIYSVCSLELRYAF